VSKEQRRILDEIIRDSEALGLYDLDAPRPEVLGVEGAARFLGFHPYTIREKARAGQIPGRKVGREWRFTRRQLLDWLEGGER